MKKYLLFAALILLALPIFAQNYYLSCAECEQIYETNCTGCPTGSTAGTVSFEGITIKTQAGQIVARIPAPLSSHYDSRGNVSIYTKGNEAAIAGKPTKFMTPFSRIKKPTGANYSNYNELLSFIEDCGGCVVPAPAQVLSIEGDDISLSGGGGTVTVTHPPNLDNDPTNEYNTDFNFTTTTLSITDGGGLLSVDLSSLVNTDNQQLLPLSFIGNVLTVALENGGIQQINLSGLISSMVNNANATYTHTDGNGNPTNIGYRLSYDPVANIVTLVDLAGNVANSVIIQREYNTAFTLIENNLSITDGNGALSVSLLPYLDNTDNQTLSLIGQNLSISGGNTVVLPTDNDPDPSNELNTGFALVGNQLTVTDAGGGLSVGLAQYLDNTDNQTLSLLGSTISITGGNSITLPTDNDPDPANELNTAFTLIADQLTMTDAGGDLSVDLSPYNSPDTHLFSDDKTATATRSHDLSTFNFSLTHDAITAMKIGDEIGPFGLLTDAALLEKTDGASASFVGVGDATGLGGASSAVFGVSGNLAIQDYSSLNITQDNASISTFANSQRYASVNMEPESATPSMVNNLTIDGSELGWAAIHDTGNKLFSNIYYADVSGGGIQDLSRWEASDIGTNGMWIRDALNNTAFELKMNDSGLTIEDGINSLLFNIDPIGEVTAHKYPSTRDDTGANTPANFIYTSPSGLLQSAPLSTITTTVQRDLVVLTGGETGVTLTSAPTANNNITLSLNGQILYDGIDWTIAGNTISFTTYIGTAGHAVEVKYW